MAFCEQCGKEVGQTRFCENCGADNGVERHKRPRKQGKLLLWMAVCLIMLSAVLYIVLFKEKDTERENAVEEEVIEKSQEEPQEERQEEPEEILTIEKTDLLQEMKNGGLLNLLHLGTTKAELIKRFGAPVKVYSLDGEVHVEYADAVYTAGEQNDLIYFVMLKPMHAMKYSFETVVSALGEGDEHIIFERGKGDDGLYYISYGTEDSTLTFYSPTEKGKSAVKITYSNVSILSAELPADEESQTVPMNDVEPFILKIREQYYAINDSTSSMKQTTVQLDNGLQKKIFTNQNGHVKKLIEPSTEGTAEYYYDDAQKIVFIFTHKERAENRYYFHDSQLIRWIDPNKTTIDHAAGQANKEYKKLETKWLQKASLH